MWGFSLCLPLLHVLLQIRGFLWYEWERTKRLPDRDAAREVTNKNKLKRQKENVYGRAHMAGESGIISGFRN